MSYKLFILLFTTWSYVFLLYRAIMFLILFCGNRHYATKCCLCSLTCNPEHSFKYSCVFIHKYLGTVMYSEHYWIHYTSERMGSFHTVVGVELRLVGWVDYLRKTWGASGHKKLSFKHSEWAKQTCVCLCQFLMLL